MPEVRVIPPIAQAAKQLWVAAYARVSSGSDDQLNSFAVQVAYYTELIQKNEDWVFAGIYADEAVTGTRADKRTEFQRLLQDCRAGKIDRILTKSISRFARNTLDCIEAVRELQALGVSVKFEKEGIDTGKMGSEMLLSMLSAAAQEESLSISRNLKWAIRKRMEAGTFKLSNAPFGYLLEDGKLRPNPKEAPIVQYIFDSYLAGKSLTEIAEELNNADDPVMCSKKLKWYPRAIQYILANEKYIGDSLLQKKFTPEIVPHQQKPNRGQVPKYYVVDSHQGIISKEDFERTQQLLSNRQAMHAVRERKNSPLKRILKCGLCRSALHRHQWEEIERWTCAVHRQKCEACSMQPVYTKEIHHAFLTLYDKLLANIGILESVLAELQQLQSRINWSRPDILRLNQEIMSLVKQNHTLARLQSKGGADAALFIERFNANNQKIAALRKTLLQAQETDETVELDDMIRETKNLLSLLKNGKMLTEFAPETFRKIVIRITVWPDKFEFHLTNGLMLEERRDKK